MATVPGSLETDDSIDQDDLGDLFEAISAGGTSYDTIAVGKSIDGTKSFFENLDGDGLLVVSGAKSTKLGKVKLTDGTKINVDDVVLTEGAQNARGNAGANHMLGNEDNNLLMGGGGDDYLNGSGGRDTVMGGAGNDTIEGGAGNDKLSGGAGSDVFIINGDGHDKITDFKGGDQLKFEAGTTVDLQEDADGDAFFVVTDAQGHVGTVTLQDVGADKVSDDDNDGVWTIS